MAGIASASKNEKDTVDKAASSVAESAVVTTTVSTAQEEKDPRNESVTILDSTKAIEASETKNSETKTQVTLPVEVSKPTTAKINVGTTTTSSATIENAPSSKTTNINTSGMKRKEVPSSVSSVKSDVANKVPKHNPPAPGKSIILTGSDAASSTTSIIPGTTPNLNRPTTAPLPVTSSVSSSLPGTTTTAMQNLTSSLADYQNVSQLVHDIFLLLETYGPLTGAQLEFNLPEGSTSFLKDILELLVATGLIDISKPPLGTTTTIDQQQQQHYYTVGGRLRQTVVTPSNIVQEIQQTQLEWKKSQLRQERLISALKSIQSPSDQNNTDTDTTKNKKQPNPNSSSFIRDTIKSLLVEFPDIAYDPVYVTALRNLHIDIGLVLGGSDTPKANTTGAAKASKTTSSASSAAPTGKKKKKRKKSQTPQKTTSSNKSDVPTPVSTTTNTSETVTTEKIPNTPQGLTISTLASVIDTAEVPEKATDPSVASTSTVTKTTTSPDKTVNSTDSSIVLSIAKGTETTATEATLKDK